MTDAEWALVMRTAEREYYVNKRGMCKTINLETGKEVVNDGLLVRDRNMERLYLNQQPVARLVAKAFLNPPVDRKWRVIRKKADPFDNSVENLRIKVVGEK